MIKKFLKTFENVFVYYFASLGISLLIGIILNIPLKLLFDIDKNILNFIPSILCVSISLFVLFFKNGYSDKKFQTKNFLFSLILLLVLIIILTMLIGHAIYISGPTNYIADFIFKKLNPDLYYTPIELRTITLNRYKTIAMISAFVFIYSPIMLLGEYLGTKKHKRDFKKIKQDFY